MASTASSLPSLALSHTCAHCATVHVSVKDVTAVREQLGRAGEAAQAPRVLTRSLRAAARKKRWTFPP